MKKRIKFCEWNKITGKTCGNLLTEKQHDFCKYHNQPFLCWGHQQQYKFQRQLEYSKFLEVVPSLLAIRGGE